MKFGVIGSGNIGKSIGSWAAKVGYQRFLSIFSFYCYLEALHRAIGSFNGRAVFVSHLLRGGFMLVRQRSG